jgi:hypothetical protein
MTSVPLELIYAEQQAVPVESSSPPSPFSAFIQKETVNGRGTQHAVVGLVFRTYM